MTVEELEAEVSRLRGELDAADSRYVALQDTERERVRRNAALYERIRYVEHRLREIHTTIGEILADGIDT